MSVYSLIDVSIHDPDSYESYKKLTLASIAAFGANSSCVVLSAKYGKVYGKPSALSSLNFLLSDTRKPGVVLNDL